MSAFQELKQSRLVAFTVLAALIVGSLSVTAMSIADVIDRRQALTDTEQTLSRLTARSGRGNKIAQEMALPGSPFLEGQTLTVAGATLLQRVAAAVATAGGSLQSSQLDVDGAASRGNMIGLTVNCEVDQPMLQGLLYDLEAGMPFLFVERLDVSAPQSTAASASGPVRVRLLLNVTGQWWSGP